MSFHLDPRSKLFLLLLANLMLFFHAGVMIEGICTFLFLIPFFFSCKAKIGLRLAVIYFILLVIDISVIPHADNYAFLNLILLFSSGIRMMLPCIITGAYVFTTTSMSEFIAALRLLHVPESMIITCSVVVRFFPSVKEDYTHIKDAMSLRGIAEEKNYFIKHPAKSLEYILMPLLMNASSVAQDLSIAALTKGIGIRKAHTSMCTLNLKVSDIIYPFLCTLPLLYKVVIL